MTGPQRNPDELLAVLDRAPLNRLWANLEIVLGLFAVGIALLLGGWAVSRPTPEIDWRVAPVTLVLFVLGGYLTLAGHRCHLYQVANETTTNLLIEIQNRKDKGPPE
jgi:hypothetical protein